MSPRTAPCCSSITARVTPEAKAELEANGVTLADYDSILDVMAAETEPQTVLAESATVNYAVYQVLENNPALTVKDAGRPAAGHEGREERGGAGPPDKRSPICGTPWPWCGSRSSWKTVWLPANS